MVVIVKYVHKNLYIFPVANLCSNIEQLIILKLSCLNYSTLFVLKVSH